MRKNHERFEALSAIVAAQDGIVTAGQLAEIGFAKATTSRRTRTGGMWTRVLPGVHLVTGGRPDRAQRERAALLYAGPDAVLTGGTALRRYGVRAARLQEVDDDPRLPETVHVLVPHQRRRMSTGFVRIERTHRMPPKLVPTRSQPLALAPPARAVADAARRMSDEWDVLALVTEAVRVGLVEVDTLADEAHAGPRRGAAFLRGALAAARAGVWSGPEADMRDVVISTGLPEPLWNVAIVAPSGAVIAIPDGWFDDVGLALEVDSREHHADGRDWERTLARQQRYAAHGVLVVPVTPRQLQTSRRGVATAILAAYAAAKRRPRPEVLAVTTRPPIDAAPPPFRWGA